MKNNNKKQEAPVRPVRGGDAPVRWSVVGQAVNRAGLGL